MNTLFVAVPPKIITRPTEKYAAAPFSAVFCCSVQAYGYLTIDWYRNGNNLPKKAFSKLVPSVSKTTNILTIPNVTSEDVGMYYCEAWANMLAARSHAVKLFLAGKILNVINIVLICRVYTVHVCRSTSTTSCSDNSYSKPYY